MPLFAVLLLLTCPAPVISGATVLPGAPATLALAAPADGGATRVEVTVRGYHPASDGAVQIVVEAPSRTGMAEIGRFGLFPERIIAADDPDQAQRFALPLGTRPVPATIRVRLLPAGRGVGARADVVARLTR